MNTERRIGGDSEAVSDSGFPKPVNGRQWNSRGSKYTGDYDRAV